MKIAFGSDLHLEFGGAEPSLDPVRGADVLVLAGDIARGRLAKRECPLILKYAKQCAEALGLPVITVAGNHEFYGQEYNKFMAGCREYVTDMTSVYFLENDVVNLDGVRFVGCTLWSDFRAAKDVAFAMQLAKTSINDYQKIKLANEARTSFRKLSPRDTAAKCLESKQFLKKAFHEDFSGPTVAVTHFPPVFASDPQYLGDQLSHYFCNDWRKEIEEGSLSPDLWITGHTHYSTEMQIATTRLVSRQAGYPDELEPFEWGIVEV